MSKKIKTKKPKKENVKLAAKKTLVNKFSSIAKLHYNHKKNSGNYYRLIFKFLLKWAFIAVIFIGTITFAITLYYIHDLPDLAQAEQLKKQRKITILAANNTILTNYGDLYNKYVPYKDIPKVLINAVVATEDRRFFKHFGVDVFGLVRAFYINYRAGYIVQGGSTITQQLAKIIFLSANKTLKRKIQELVLALYLEYKFSKEQIITMYLNRVYLGSAIYGIDGAAKYYFGKDIKKINLYEAAIIASVLKAPSKYSPTNNIDLAAQRAYLVLLNMQDAGYISKEQILLADDNPVLLETAALGGGYGLYFSDYVADWASTHLKDQESDLIIKTTLDPMLQKKAEKAVQNYLALSGKELNINQGALIAFNRRGAIVALVGGRDYKKSPFNRAINAKRQAGSTFKLFVYLAAIEQNNLQASSMVNDASITVGKWRPKNFSRHYLGEITLKQAFSQSVNTVAVKLSEQTGRGKVIKMAQKLGISSPMKPHPSLALGAVEVNLLELTKSYGIINNDGNNLAPYGIEEIKTAKGKVLYKHQKLPQKKLISSPALSVIKELLQEVVKSGTAKSLKDFEAYGKTGTTQNYNDAWFIGFKDELTCGVWVGNDDNKHMKKVTGGSAPAVIWGEFMGI